MLCEQCNFENSSENLLCNKCGAKLFRAKLRVSQGNGLNQTYYLFSKKYKIGRGANNDVVIEDSSVSRYHAEISLQRGYFYFKDNGSKNGSLINSQRVTQKRLVHLDCIQLGNAVIHFYDEKNNPLYFDAGIQTEEYIQKEFFKFAEKRHTKIKSDDVLLTMLDLAISLLHAEQGAILITDPSKGLRFKIGKNHDGEIITEEELVDLDWEIIKESIESRKTKAVSEGSTSEEHKNEDIVPIQWHKTAVPLISTQSEQSDEPHCGYLGNDGILGVFYFSQKQKTHSLSKKKQELLVTLAQQAAYAIENEILFVEAKIKRKIEDELSLARDIQQRLLPTTIPNITNFEMASFVQPCESVGGDYYDFVPISTKCVGISIGDICGKGVPAALLTATVQAAIRSQLEYTLSPQQIVRNLNRLFIKSTAESIFLTLFFGILDVKECQLKYINAGHPPPIFISKDRIIRELSGTTPALGIFEGKLEKEKSIAFEPGDLLLLYTDGIIESQNQEKEIYGRKRLLQFIHSLCLNERTRTHNPDSLIKCVKDDLFAFVNGAKQTDDLTLLAFKRR
ncbi:MAG: SpoIIE family protein phosphatase [bacterium]